ncbi:hypothetical protein DL93DRAFT_2156937 [Clavulina sp. PMI_390]|nr:hypothetical protein DL93DRAFT_2156937 [Clavulina sp. PMI_390]
MSGFNDDLVKNSRKAKAGTPGLEWEHVDYDAAEPSPVLSESRVRSLTVNLSWNLGADSSWFTSTWSSDTEHGRLSATPLPDTSPSLSPPFPGGDIVLRTTDGYRITAHSLILQIAAPDLNPLFVGLSGDGDALGGNSDIFTVPCSGESLRVLLQLIYPISTVPPAPSTAMLTDILRGARSLHITAIGARTTLNDWIKAESNPLSSWALARVFGYSDAERFALRRVFQMEGSLVVFPPQEMRLVDAVDGFRLLAARERALNTARLALEGVGWECPYCQTLVVEAPAQPSCMRHDAPEQIPACANHRPGSNQKDCKACRVRRNRISCTCPPKELDWFGPPADSAQGSMKAMESPESDSGIHVDRDWKASYVQTTATLNPFHPNTTSELEFKTAFFACPLLCGHSALSFNSDVAKTARANLRRELDDIVAIEYERLRNTADA